MKVIIFLFLAILFTSCANHSDDGVYVGAAGLTLVTWVIDGNNVAIYTIGEMHKESIEHGSGYVRLVSNGTLLEVKDDSDGNRSLVVQGIMPIELKRVSQRTDISPTEIMEGLKRGYKKL